MTDADVDGAHISTLLMAFFYKEFPKLIDEGHLYLSCLLYTKYLKELKRITL